MHPENLPGAQVGEPMNNDEMFLWHCMDPKDCNESSMAVYTVRRSNVSLQYSTIMAMVCECQCGNEGDGS